MMVSKNSYGYLLPIAGIIAFIFIVHGLLLLNDGIYWDDWLWINPANNHIQLDFVKSTNNQMGYMITNSVHLWIFSLLGYRAVTFGAIMIIGIGVFVIGRYTKVLAQSDAFMIALITVSYPAFRTWIVLSTANYLFYYALFFMGIILALFSENRKRYLRVFLKILALLLFFLSFNLNSLLLFYFGFIVLLLKFAYRRNGVSWKRHLICFIPRCFDYILLPFIYWAIKELFFPRHGLYSEYNQFALSPSSILLNLAYFIKNGIYEQFNASLRELIYQPALWLVGIMGVLLGLLLIRKGVRSEQSVKPYVLMAFGFLLFVLGIVPYIAVGLGPSLTGWNTRHSLLIALPIAIVMIGFARLTFSAPKSGYSRIGWIFLSSLLLSFSLMTVTAYMNWQARWIKDRSVMLNLAQLEGASDYSIYWIDDQYPLGGEDHYRFYEWSSIFKFVWGDDSRIGLDMKYCTAKSLEQFKSGFIASYNLGSFDPKGCQANLLILSGGGVRRSNIKLTARYFYYKFLNPQGMNSFLSEITKIQIQPVNSLLAINCKH